MAKKVPKPISRTTFWIVLFCICFLYGFANAAWTNMGYTSEFVPIVFIPIILLALWSYYYKKGQWKKINRITAQNAREEMGEEDK